MNKRLVILTTHFGTNFSGGSTATCEIFSRLESQFSEIVVVGTMLGDHPFKSLQFIKYRTWLDCVRTLRGLTENTTFYGDFYNSLLFILAGVPYYFTYHDNWPELAKDGYKNRFRSVFYTSIYKLIFRHAIITITVSQFKLAFIKKYSSNTALVYNGFEVFEKEHDNLSEHKKPKILMVGNVDSRKYRLANELFKNWDNKQNASVNIYGNINDHKIASQLSRKNYVNLKGFIKNLPYTSYDLLLHTSTMENLPIVFCEAIYHGLPVLAFDVGGSKEVISNNNNGVLIPRYNIDLMKEELDRMLTININKITDKKILEKHSWDSASDQYLNILINS